MHEADAKDLGAMLHAIMGMHGKDLSEPMFDIWWESLKRFELTDIRRALNIHVQNPDAGQFVPKPADVIRYLNGSTGTQALRAWSRVEKAIRQVGPYQSVIFDDPIIHAVVCDMGGWIKVCEGTEDELPFKGREFEKRYQSYALNPPQAYPRALIGMAEAENNKNGFESAPPVLVGDQDKAIACYHRGGDMTGLPVHRPKGIAEILSHMPEKTMKALPPAPRPKPDEVFQSDPVRRAEIEAEIDKAIRQAHG